ncbi:MAG TPA: hypothetical protein DD415_02135 [Clostridiales bacterium]|nr:hypothetical protein [Clostridiales bacterium]
MASTYLNDEFFSRLETLAFNLRSDLAGFFGGKHLVNRYGQTVEFADYREYMLGDDIRRIDWNLYSRFEKFFIKLFTDERQMHVQIFLDCSASMGKDMPQKSAYATAVAAAIGFLAVHNTDKVSFYLMRGDRCDSVDGVLVGKRSFFNAVRWLENIEFDGETDIGAAVTSCSTGTGEGLSVIISDFFTDSDWRKAVDYLTFKRRQVLLIQVMTPDEIEPTYSGRVHLMDLEAEDLEDMKNMKLRINSNMQVAYKEALEDIISTCKTFCHSRDAEFITVSTDKPIEKTLFSELMKVGITG